MSQLNNVPDLTILTVSLKDVYSCAHGNENTMQGLQESTQTKKLGSGNIDDLIT